MRKKEINNMLNEQQTQDVISNFYQDCFRFWITQGKSAAKAHKLAFNDCSHLERNPYEPNGEKFDTEMKLKCLREIL